MTLVNFAATLTVPRLTRRFGNARLLAGGIAVSCLGMVWLSRLDGDTADLAGVALPMLLIGAGQGATLSPARRPAWPMSSPRTPAPHRCLVNVTHQLGAPPHTIGLSD